MKILKAAIVCAATLSFCGCASENLKKGFAMNDKSGLLIGWASRDITPKGKVNLAGQFHMRVTDKVKDPLSVTALSITSKSTNDSVIFISCDLVSINTPLIDKVNAMIKTACPDFPVDKLIINATHSHTSLDIRENGYKYNSIPKEEAAGLLTPAENLKYVSEKITEAAVESWNSRKPGMLAWGFSYAVVGHNRRVVYLEDFSKLPDYQETPGRTVEKNARMYGKTNVPNFSHIEGFEDHTVQFLFTFDMDKKLTGSLINIVCPAQETGGAVFISADFWHEVRVLLHKKYGNDFFILPQCAAAGDQVSYRMIYKAAEERKLKLKELDARMDIAEKIRNAFDDAYSWASKDMKDSLEVKHLTREIKLSAKIPATEEYEKNLKWAKEFEAMPKLDSKQQTFLRRCKDVINRYEKHRENEFQPVEIHVVRIGDIVFATNPFELFLDYGIRIQAQSPATQTFIVQLAGKGISMGGSYLPTKRAEEGGGYSAYVYCNKVGSQGGEELVKETLKSINELFPPKEIK